MPDFIKKVASRMDQDSGFRSGSREVDMGRKRFSLDHAIKVRILASQPTPLLPFIPRFQRLAIRPDPLIAFSPKP